MTDRISTELEPVADVALDEKMRAMWAHFKKPWMRRELRKFLPPTRAEVMACQFVLNPRDNHTEFRMWENGVPLEHEATAHIAERLAGQDAVIVDVGANAGAFFLPILKRAGAGARAVVFEPNPVMRARVRTNVELNGFTDRVTIFDCAVGDAVARSALFLPGNGNLGQGRVQVDYGKSGKEAGVEVDIRPLADCLADAGVDRIDFLKVDVEGVEDKVIHPFLSQTKVPHPELIYFEIVHDGVWTYPVLQTLESQGYVTDGVFEKNALYARKAKTGG